MANKSNHVIFRYKPQITAWISVVIFTVKKNLDSCLHVKNTTRFLLIFVEARMEGFRYCIGSFLTRVFGPHLCTVISLQTCFHLLQIHRRSFGCSALHEALSPQWPRVQPCARPLHYLHLPVSANLQGFHSARGWETAESKGLFKLSLWEN